MPPTKYKVRCFKYLPLLILLVLAAFLRQWPAISLMGRDETSYAFLIKHFVDGTFFDDYIFIAFHPFFSFIASPIAAFGVNPELAGRIVAYSFGVLSVVPVFFVGKLLFSELVGYIAALMTATFPVLVKWAGIVQAQTTYSFMLLMSFLFVILFYSKWEKLYAFFAGFFLCLAYLSRAEGLGIFVGNVILIGVTALKNSNERKKILAGLVIFVSTFLIFAAPYMYALRVKTGEVKFTNKVYQSIKAAVIVSYDLDYEKYNYSKAALDEKDVLIMALKVYPEKIWDCIKNFPNYYGVFSIIFTLLFLFLLFFQKAKLKAYLFFLPYLYVILVLPFFFVAENYFIPYAPFIFILSAVSIDALKNVISSKGNKFPATLFVSFVCFFIVYDNVLHSRIKSYFFKPAQSFDVQHILYASYRDFGREVASYISPNAKIMARFNIGAWYSGGEFVVFPDVSWDEFIDYLKKQKVDYIILGPAEMNMRRDIFNEIIWRCKGIIKDDRFKIVKRIVNNYYIEFYLVRVRL